MILADSSAWVEYDRATGSPVDERMHGLIRDRGPLMVTEPVVMEVTSGARSDARERDLRRLMARFGLLRFDPVADFAAAARLYRTCRRQGITPRGLIDCMIAVVAWRNGASILAHDIDLARIAPVLGIPLDEASLTESGRGRT